MEEKNFKPLISLLNDDGLFNQADWHIVFNRNTPIARKSSVKRSIVSRDGSRSTYQKPEPAQKKYQNIVDTTQNAHQTVASCCLALVREIVENIGNANKNEKVDHFWRLIAHISIVYLSHPLSDDEAQWIKLLSACPSVLKAFLTVRLTLLETNEARQEYLEKHRAAINEFYKEQNDFEFTNQALTKSLNELLGNEFYEAKKQLISFINALLPEVGEIGNEKLLFSLLQVVLNKNQLLDEECNQLSSRAKKLFFREENETLLARAENLYAEIEDIEILEFFPELGQEKDALLKNIKDLCETLKTDTLTTDYRPGIDNLNNRAKTFESLSSTYLAFNNRKKEEESEFEREVNQRCQEQIEFFRAELLNIQTFLAHQANKNSEFFKQYYENTIRCYQSIEKEYFLTGSLIEQYQYACDVASESYQVCKCELLKSIEQLNQIIEIDLYSWQKREVIFESIVEQLKPLLNPDSLANDIEVVIKQMQQRIEKRSETIPSPLIETFYHAFELDSYLHAPSPLVAITYSRIFDEKKKLELFEQFSQTKFYRQKKLSPFVDYASKSCVTHSEITALDLFAHAPNNESEMLYSPIWHVAQFGSIPLLETVLPFAKDKAYQSYKDHALEEVWLTASPSEQTLKKVKALIEVGNADVASIKDGKSLLLRVYLAHGNHFILRHVLRSEYLKTVPEDFMCQVAENQDRELAKLILDFRKRQSILAPVNIFAVTALMPLAQEFDAEFEKNAADFQKIKENYNAWLATTKKDWLRQKRLFEIEKKRILAFNSQFPDSFSLDEWESICNDFRKIADLLNGRKKREEDQDKAINSFQKEFSEQKRLDKQKEVLDKFSIWFQCIQQSDPKNDIDKMFQTPKSVFDATVIKVHDELEQKHKRCYQIKGSLLEDIEKIEEVFQETSQKINKLLKHQDNAELTDGIPEINAEQLLISLGKDADIFHQINKRLEDFENRARIEPVNNIGESSFVIDLNKLVEEKINEYLVQEQGFWFWLVYWLADLIEGSDVEDWYIFSWILTSKHQCDVLTHSKEQLNTLKTSFEKLNQALPLNEELMDLESFQQLIGQLEYSEALKEAKAEDTQALNNYLTERKQRLTDTQRLIPQIEQLKSLNNHLKQDEQSLLGFQPTRKTLNKEIKIKEKELKTLERKLGDLKKEMDLTAAEKNAAYYSKNAREKNCLPIALICNDIGLADAEKFQCSAHLIDRDSNMLFQTDVDGNSSLHIAINNNQLSIAQKIISEKPELICLKNNAGETPISIAFHEKKTQFISDFMLQTLSQPSIDELKQNFLKAVERGDIELVKLFLEHKLQLNLEIHSAIADTLKFKQEIIFKLLIPQVDLQDFLYEFMENNGKINKVTALILAIRNDAYFAIDDLLKTDSKENINYHDQFGETALKIAVSKNQPDIVRKLVQAGAKEGCYPLLSNLPESVNDEVVLWLLLAEVRLFRLEEPLYQGDLSKFLYLASVNVMMNPAEKQEVISRLTKHGIQFKPMYCDDQGNALHHFIKAGPYEAVNMLLSNLQKSEDKVRINQPNAQGDTALHVAVRGDTQPHQKIAVVLINEGANFAAINKDGHSPLWLAAHSNNIPMFEAVFNAAIAKHSSKTTSMTVSMVVDRASSNVIDFFSMGLFNPLAMSGIFDRNIEMCQDLIKKEESKTAWIHHYPGQQHTLLFSIYTSTHLSPTFKAYVLNFLLEHGAVLYPDECDANGNTLLHLLVKNGNFLLCKKIIDQMKVSKEVLNKSNQEGNTPLHLAARGKSTDYLKIAELLLNNGAESISYNHLGLLPLHLAASSQMVEILSKKCPIAQPTKLGQTLEELLFANPAKSRSDWEILTHIFNQKPLEEKTKIQKQTAENQLSVIEGKLTLMPENKPDESPVVNLTEKEKALFKKIYDNSLTKEEYSLAFSGVDLRCVDEEMTLLGCAIAKNNKDLVLHLLKVLKVDPNQKICMEGFPLFLAIRNGQKEIIRKGPKEIIKCLIDCGARLDCEVNGYTPLHYAAKYDKTATGEILTQLLKQSTVGVDIRSTTGDTPLLTAIKSRNLSAVKALIQKGADVTATDAKGNFPLMLAIQHDAIDIVEYLLTCEDIDINQTDFLGNTALHAALQSENHEHFFALKKCNKSQGLKSKLNAEGETPLIASNQSWITWVTQEIPYKNITFNQENFSSTIEDLKKVYIYHRAIQLSPSSQLDYVAKQKYYLAKYEINEAAKRKGKLEELKKRLFDAVGSSNFTEISDLFFELDTEKSQIIAAQTKNKALRNRALRDHEYLLTELVNAADDQGNTVLHHLSGIVVDLVQSIKQIFSPSQVDELVNEAQRKQVIFLLLEHGANLEAKNNQGIPISIYTLERLYFGDSVAKMDYENKSINENQNKITGDNYFPIFCGAIKNKKENLFKVQFSKANSLQIEESLNKQTTDGDTLLHLALRYGTEDIIFILLTKMRELKALDAIHKYNKAGQTPFHLVMRRKDALKYVSTFIELGADLNQRTEIFERTPLDIAKETIFDGTWKNSLDSINKIIIAPKRVRIEGIESYSLIMQTGFDARQITPKGSSTNPILFFHRVDDKVIVRYDDGIHHQNHYKIPFNEIRHTIHDYFPKEDRFDIAPCQINITKKDDKFSRINWLWETIYTYNSRKHAWDNFQNYQSTQHKNLAEAKQFISNAEKIKTRTDDSGDTLLHAIVKRNDTALMGHVLKHYYVGDDINWRNSDGDTPLHLAVRLENLHMIAFLLQKCHLTQQGADITQKDAKGFTALDLAVQLRNEKIICLMLTYCGSEDNKFAQTRFDAKKIAEQSGDSELQRLFEQPSTVEFDQYYQAVENFYLGSLSSFSYCDASFTFFSAAKLSGGFNLKNPPAAQTTRVDPL